MTPDLGALLLNTAAGALTVGLVWAATRPPRPVPVRICGAELIPDIADEPWVCVRPPHPDTEDHQALDGSTWRD